MNPRSGRLDSEAPPSAIVDALRRQFFRGRVSQPEPRGQHYSGAIEDHRATVVQHSRPPVRMDLIITAEPSTTLTYTLGPLRPQDAWMAYVLPALPLIILLALGLGADGRGPGSPELLRFLAVLGLIGWVLSFLLIRLAGLLARRSLEAMLRLAVRRAEAATRPVPGGS